MPPDAAAGGSPEPTDQEQVTYDRAKAILMASLPTPAAQSAGSDERSQIEDREVEILVQIGAYALDRWGAEQSAYDKQPLSTKAGARRAAARRDADECTGLHFKASTKNAHAKLRAYQDRHRQVMPATIVRDEMRHLPQAVVDALPSAPTTPAYEHPFHWQWLLIEASKGFVGFLGLTIIGGTVAAIIVHMFPHAPHAIVDGLRQVLEPGAPSGDAAPSQRGTT